MSDPNISCFLDNGKCISSSVFIPGNFFQRAKGLLGRQSMDKDEAMLFYNCSSIHMFGMRFSIDVVFLDTRLQVTKLVRSVRPWRLTSCKRAKHVMELAEGSIVAHNLFVGDKLVINRYM